MSTGRSRVNSRVIWLFSSEEELERVRSPWIVDSSSSSTSVTAVSTTCALAPGSVVDTEMIGGSMSGSSRTARRVYPMTPKSTRAAENMLARTGRRMDVSERFIGPEHYPNRFREREGGRLSENRGLVATPTLYLRRIRHRRYDISTAVPRGCFTGSA